MKCFHPSCKKEWLGALFILSFFIIASLLLPLPADAGALPYILIPISLLVIGAALIKTIEARLTTYTISEEAIVLERVSWYSFKHTIPLKSIDNAFTKTSVLGRLLSLTDLYIDTPGGEGIEMVLRNIPQNIADEVLALVEKTKKEG